jgi:hypothetical protein
MPQPIDLQTELGRIAAVERIQQLAERVSLAARQQQVNETQEKRVAAESQVREARQKNEQVDPELRRRNPYVRVKRAQGEPAGEEEMAGKEPEQAAPVDEVHHFDISI